MKRVLTNPEKNQPPQKKRRTNDNYLSNLGMKVTLARTRYLEQVRQIASQFRSGPILQKEYDAYLKVLYFYYAALKNRNAYKNLAYPEQAQIQQSNEDNWIKIAKAYVQQDLQDPPPTTSVYSQINADFNTVPFFSVKPMPPQPTTYMQAQRLFRSAITNPKPQLSTKMGSSFLTFSQQASINTTQHQP